MNLYQTTSLYDESTLGDPSMVWIAPVEQQIEDIMFSPFEAQSITIHYINVVINSEDVGNITLNNNNISSNFSVVNGNPDYMHARIPINSGSHRLQSSSGFTYGYAQGYAYSVGSSTVNLSRELFLLFYQDSVIGYQYENEGIYTVKNITKLEYENCMGSFYDTLTLTFRYYHIHAKPSHRHSDRKFFCSVPFPYNYADHTITESGVYEIPLQSVYGYDSIIDLEVVFEDTYIRIVHEGQDLCVSQSLILETVCNFYIFIPNAITPGRGEGINDVFQIPWVEFSEPSKFELFTYNRWGALILHSTDPDFQWDGTDQGGIIRNTMYNYHINLTVPQGKTKAYKGTITVL